MSKKQITKEMRKELRAPFPNEAYDYLKHKPEFTTLKAMFITERLNDVFGLGRWTISFEIIEKDNNNIVLQGEFISYDYEIMIPKQFGGHSLNRKGMELADAYKSAVTDCQSKIASYLEVGIDMFKGMIRTPEQEKAIKEKYQNTGQKYPQQQPQKKTYPKKQPVQQKPTVKKLQNDIDDIQKGKIIKMPKEKQVLTDDHKDFNNCVEYLAGGGSMEKLKIRFTIDPLVEKGLNQAAADLVFLYWQREQQQRQG